MNILRSLVLAAAVLALASCSKKAQPSAEFAQAQQLWTTLVQQSALEAHADPRADEVLALLARVDPSSLDAQAAQELKKRIEADRAEAQAAAERRAEMLEAAATPTEILGGGYDSPAAPEPAPAPVEPVAAAPADETQPKEGMDEALFKQKFDRCFEYKNPFGTPGGQSGDVWALKDLSLCREVHSAFVTQSVLLMDGKVAAIRSNAELTPVSYKLVDGKLVPMDDDAAKPAPAPAVAADSASE